MRVCVDLDRVLAHCDRYESMEKIGDPIPGAREFLQQLKNQGLEIIIFTARICEIDEDGSYYANQVGKVIIKEWLSKHNLPHDRVEMKIGAVAYIDDRAISCTPQEGGKLSYMNAVDRVKRLIKNNNDPKELLE